MTATASTQKAPFASAQPPAVGPSLLARLGGLLLTLIIIVGAVVLALPVILLFVATSVPTVLAIGLAGASIAILAAVLRLRRTPLSLIVGLAAYIGVAALAVWLSQIFASTPPIVDAQGNPVPNSIAVMEQVNLGGANQWITIRGRNVDNPVLLFLAGGPGGSELAWTRHTLGGLEDHFVVVNWDQPGAGKSYGAVDIATLTPERFLNDAYQLTQLLRDRFDEDKIYVLGESWGSILGIRLVQQHPELFHAYVGSGQMVYTVRDDIMGYEFALDYAEQDGNSELVQSLERTGPPPYTGDGMFWTYAAYLNVLNSYMYSRADGEGGGHNQLFDALLAPEYGLIDKVNWVRGLSDVFTVVYPQLGEIDLTTTAASLEVPVYFVVGRWDVNAMASLVEEYYAVLEAPHKSLIWFENSSHTPLYEEPRHFVDVMANTVLAETYTP